MTSLTNGHVYKDINQIKNEEGVASGSQQGAVYHNGCYKITPLGELMGNNGLDTNEIKYICG